MTTWSSILHTKGRKIEGARKARGILTEISLYIENN